MKERQWIKVCCIDNIAFWPWNEEHSYDTSENTKMKRKEMCRVAECITLHSLALLQVKRNVGELLSL